jgi:hypothetical protein
VKFGVVSKAPETFGYQTLEGWPRTDGGWKLKVQSNKFFKELQDLFMRPGQMASPTLIRSAN